MLSDRHTITIEAVGATGGGQQMAVVERFNGSFVEVCATAADLADGMTLAGAAAGYAAAYGATFDVAAAVAEAALVAL